MNINHLLMGLSTLVVSISLPCNAVANETHQPGGTDNIDDVISKERPEEANHPFRVKFRNAPINASGKYQQYSIRQLNSYITMDQDGDDVRLNGDQDEKVKAMFIRHPEPEFSDYFHIVNAENLEYLRVTDYGKVSFQGQTTYPQQYFWAVEKVGNNYRMKNLHTESYVTWWDVDSSTNDLGLSFQGDNYDRVLWHLDKEGWGHATINDFDAKLYGAEIREQELTALDVNIESNVSIDNLTGQDGVVVKRVSTGGSTSFTFTEGNSISNTAINTHTVSHSLTRGIGLEKKPFTVSGELTVGHSWTTGTEKTTTNSKEVSNGFEERYSVSAEVRHNYVPFGDIKIYATSRQAVVDYSYSGTVVKQYNDGNISSPQQVKDVVEGVFNTDFEFKVVDRNNSIMNRNSLDFHNVILKNGWRVREDLQNRTNNELKTIIIDNLARNSAESESRLRNMRDHELIHSGYLYHWVSFANLVTRYERNEMTLNQMKNVIQDYVMIQTKKTAFDLDASTFDTIDLLQSVFGLYSDYYNLNRFYVYPALIDAGDVIALLDWRDNSSVAHFSNFDKRNTLIYELNERTSGAHIGALQAKSTQALIGDALLYYALLEKNSHNESTLRTMTIDDIRNTVIHHLSIMIGDDIGVAHLQAKSNYELARLYFDPKRSF